MARDYSKDKPGDHTGPRTAYNSGVADIMVELATQGATQAEMARVLGVNRVTITNWLKRHSELRHRVASARMPKEGADLADQIQRRKQILTDWLDDYLKSRGELTEVTTDDGNTRTKVKRGSAPAAHILEYVMGQGEGAEQKFQVSVTVAEPPEEDDED